MTVKTIDKDLGANQILKEAKELDKAFVLIGIFQGAKPYPNGVHPVEVAFWNEFGTMTAPERSFLRSTIDENKSKLVKKTEKMIDSILAGKMTVKQALNALGVMIREMTREKILTLNDPKNAPSTIQKKGMNNPLVDSRHLWRSVSYETSKSKKVGG